MTLNLNQLRVFYAAAREGSYRRASESLYITQPAVSQSIKALERYYGVGLFYKSGRSMALTQEGTILFDYARRIFQASEEAEQALREFGNLDRGEVRVGTTKIYARYLMPSLITAFRARYPRVTVLLREGSSGDMVRSVESLVNHLAVVGRVSHTSRLDSHHFRTVELALVAGANHPLAAQSGADTPREEPPMASWKDLDGQPLILREAGSGSRRAADYRLVQEGVSPEMVMESGSIDFIKRYVAEGRALSFLYKPDMREELAAGRLVHIPLIEGDLTLETDTVLLTDAHKSPAVRAFLEVLDESATAEWSVLPE